MRRHLFRRACTPTREVIGELVKPKPTSEAGCFDIRDLTQVMRRAGPLSPVHA